MSGLSVWTESGQINLKKTWRTGQVDGMQKLLRVVNNDRAAGSVNPLNDEITKREDDVERNPLRDFSTELFSI